LPPALCYPALCRPGLRAGTKGAGNASSSTEKLRRPCSRISTCASSGKAEGAGTASYTQRPPRLSPPLGTSPP